MSEKAKELIARVEGDNCKEAVLGIVADDMNPSSNFDFKEVMQTMTKQVRASLPCWYVERQTVLGSDLPGCRFSRQPRWLLSEWDRSFQPKSMYLLLFEFSIVSSKDLEFLEALQHLLMVCADVWICLAYYIEWFAAYCRNRPNSRYFAHSVFLVHRRASRRIEQTLWETVGQEVCKSRAICAEYVCVCLSSHASLW